MKLYDDKIYTKIVDLDVIFNFVVDKIFYLKLFRFSKVRFNLSYFEI